MINPSDPAFPATATSAQGRVSSGLTKREYLAAKIMAALVSTLVGDTEEPPLDLELQSKSFAIAAVAYTDALIAELNKPSLPSEVEPETVALSETVEPLSESPDYPVNPKSFEPEDCMG